MAAIGFGAGALVFSGRGAGGDGGDSGLASSALRAGTGAGEDGDRPLTAIGGSAGDPVPEVIRRVHRAKGGGIGKTLRAHLALVADTPLEGLPELLLHYERCMPGSSLNASTGDLVRGAICDRLLDEGPEVFLDLALSGRSEHVTYSLPETMGKLLEEYGYEQLVDKISAGEIPSVTVRVMESLLGQMIAEDPQRGWQLAAENPACNLGELAHNYARGAMVDAVVFHERSGELDDRTVGTAFGMLAREDPGRAFERFADLEKGSLRHAALEGFASYIGAENPPGLEEFLDRLPNDEERLAFYRARVKEEAILDDGFEGDWRSRRTAARLEMIRKIEDPGLQQILLEERLFNWKIEAPDKAREWAEQEGYGEMYQRLQYDGFPVTPVSPSSFDVRLDGLDIYVPPGVLPGELTLPTIEDDD